MDCNLNSAHTWYYLNHILMLESTCLKSLSAWLILTSSHSSSHVQFTPEPYSPQFPELNNMVLLPVQNQFGNACSFQKLGLVPGRKIRLSVHIPVTALLNSKPLPFQISMYRSYWEGALALHCWDIPNGSKGNLSPKKNKRISPTRFMSQKSQLLAAPASSSTTPASCWKCH